MSYLHHCNNNHFLAAICNHSSFLCPEMCWNFSIMLSNMPFPSALLPTERASKTWEIEKSQKLQNWNNHSYRTMFLQAGNFERYENFHKRYLKIIAKRTSVRPRSADVIRKGDFWYTTLFSLFGLLEKKFKMYRIIPEARFPENQWSFNFGPRNFYSQRSEKNRRWCQ